MYSNISLPLLKTQTHYAMQFLVLSLNLCAILFVCGRRLVGNICAGNYSNFERKWTIIEGSWMLGVAGCLKIILNQTKGSRTWMCLNELTRKDYVHCTWKMGSLRNNPQNRNVKQVQESNNVLHYIYTLTFMKQEIQDIRDNK